MLFNEEAALLSVVEPRVESRIILNRHHVRTRASNLALSERTSNVWGGK